MCWFDRLLPNRSNLTRHRRVPSACLQVTRSVSALHLLPRYSNKFPVDNRRNNTNIFTDPQVKRSIRRENNTRAYRYPSRMLIDAPCVLLLRVYLYALLRENSKLVGLIP